MIRIATVADPVPGESEVLIRVHATTVTTADWRIRAKAMPSPIFTLIAPLVLGFSRPRKQILGTECAGIVDRVGSSVKSFRPGDRVIAVTDIRMGAHAELVCVHEDSAVTTLPSHLSCEQAVAIPFGALVALRYLRDLAGVNAGQHVLVVGASGAVGVAVVQMARYLGARVTAVCSTPNVELVRSLGASVVIDRVKEDVRKSGGVYDVLVDTVGATTFAQCRHLLAPRGQFLAVLMGMTELYQMASTSLFGGKRVRGAIVSPTKADLVQLMRLAESGHIKPIIDSSYPLENIVDAHRRVDSGRKVGSVIVTVA